MDNIFIYHMICRHISEKVRTKRETILGLMNFSARLPRAFVYELLEIASHRADARLVRLPIGCETSYSPGCFDNDDQIERVYFPPMPSFESLRQLSVAVCPVSAPAAGSTGRAMLGAMLGVVMGAGSTGRSVLGAMLDAMLGVVMGATPSASSGSRGRGACTAGGGGAGAVRGGDGADAGGDRADADGGGGGACLGGGSGVPGVRVSLRIGGDGGGADGGGAGGGAASPREALPTPARSCGKAVYADE